MNRRDSNVDLAAVAREIELELEFHLQKRTEVNMARGMSYREARRDAERRLGNRRKILASGLSIFAGRPPRRGPRFEPATIRDDLRAAWRRFAREPLMATVIVAVIALGITANATVFSALNAVILQPLDFPDSDRLVRLYTREVDNDRDVSVSSPDLADWSDAASLQYTALFAGASMRMTGSEEPRTLPGGTVTAEFFDALGVEASEGRLFTRAEIEERARVIVLSASARNLLLPQGGEPIGALVRLDGQPWTVVGVVNDLDYPFAEERYWIPWSHTEYDAPEHRGQRVFNALARLAPGATLERARGELQDIAARLEAAYPESNDAISVSVLPFQESVLVGLGSGMFVLFGAVGLLLLVTCFNVAGLMLARIARLRHEIALRAALGADRWRLTRHLATDSVLLAVAGGAVSVPLTGWGVDLVKLIAPVGTPRLDQVGVDAVTALYTFGVTALVMILTAAGSTWRASRPDLLRPLQASAAGHTGRDHRRWHQTLVVAETALAVVLVIGAGLLVRSFVNLRAVDTGYNDANVLVIHLSPDQEDDRETAGREDLLTRAVQGARQLAGVERAALVAWIPQGRGFSLRRLRGVLPDAEQELVVERQVVSRGYFATLEIPLLRGDDFVADIDASADRQVIVSESLARAVWPDDPDLGIGRSLDLGAGQWRVVGVAADVRYALRREHRPTLYFHYSQEPVGSMYVVMRTRGNPLLTVPAFRRMLWSYDPDLPLEFAQPLQQSLFDALAADRFRLRLLGGFAFVAMLLCCLGVYGLMSCAVAGRARELGVRKALGAQRGAIYALLIGEGVRLVLVGVVAGAVGAAALGRFLAAFLYQVTPFDPVAYTVFPAALVLSALAACLVPARRAARTDPLGALRQ